MTAVYVMKVCRAGESKTPIYYEEIEATLHGAEQRLSELWDKYTPPDGTGYRATMRRVGDRRILCKIGW